MDAYAGTDGTVGGITAVVSVFVTRTFAVLTFDRGAAALSGVIDLVESFTTANRALRGIARISAVFPSRALTVSTFE